MEWFSNLLNTMIYFNFSDIIAINLDLWTWWIPLAAWEAFPSL